MQVYTSIISV